MAIKCPKCHFVDTYTVRFCGYNATPLTATEDIQPCFTKSLETPDEELFRRFLFDARYVIIEELGCWGIGKGAGTCLSQY